MLALSPHPEGGWFRETWRSAESLEAGAGPVRFAGARSLSTAILYLLEAGAHSRWHRLLADEVWHLYDGGPLELHLLTPEGEYRRLTLGRELGSGASFQCVVPHGCWFAAAPAADAPHALVGCTVAPGFDFADLELGARASLLARYPEHRERVLEFL